MNEEMAQGSSLLYYVVLVAILSCITFVMWQVRRARRVPAKARLGRKQATVIRYDR